MCTVLFQILNLLDKENIHYRLERTRSETIQIDAVFVGARVEIEVFEDGHIEMSRFSGSEEVESGDLEMVEGVVRNLM